MVGAQKPLYDIWGDTVNMASRMDYTGDLGKIQVRSRFAFVTISVITFTRQMYFLLKQYNDVLGHLEDGNNANR